MLTENSAFLLLMAVSILGLVGVQTFFAIYHDRAVTAAAPIRHLDDLVAQIEGKRATLLDLEDDLAKRREALANIADVQADYDATSRQLHELKAEWNQMEERRNEVRSVRDEMEQTLAEKFTVDSELATARADLDAVQDRLIAAERLFAQNETMQREHETLEAKLKDLREAVRSLEEAEARVSQLTQQVQVKERELAQIAAETERAQADLKMAREQQTAERVAGAALSAEYTQVAARVAAAEESNRAIVEEVSRLEDRRSHLQAQLARMEEQTGESAAASDETIDEKLKELKALPPVLQQMRNWKERTGENEADALKHVTERLKQSGLEYSPRVVKAFHTAMKVNETAQMAVLAGISGTGKSQLPRQYAAGMGIGFLQVPVQPRWDSPQDLMGFYNYIEKRFRPTDLARALYQLDLQNNRNDDFEDRMMMILLDEMNLARVEYYFSDFLSRLESRPPADRVADRTLRKDAEIELEIPMPKGAEAPRIFPGYNLLFAGTMNEDESTQSLSDKVVDRANVLRFAAPKTIHTGSGTLKTTEPEALSAKRWRSWVKSVEGIDSQPLVQKSAERMAKLMTDFKRPFGHRLGRAILSYVANYPIGDRGPELHAPLADQVEMRLLPKLRGLEVQNYDAVFGSLCEFVSRDLQDDPLAKAIEESVRSAEQGSGQFVWNGVTR